VTTISIVVPSFDDAVMLHHCLAALAVQTRPADEILVVDNGSRDATADVAREAGARLITEPERGVLRASAAGFDAATGDLVGRLDADSRPAADWVERVVRHFEDDPTVDVLTGTGSFYGHGRFRQQLGRHGYLGAYFQSMRLVNGRTPVFGSNFVMRREAWREVGGRTHRRDPRVHDDQDISMVLTPGQGIDIDRSLEVWVSARPFDTWSGFRRRVSWGLHGIALGWEEVSWPRRLLRSAGGWRARRAEQATLGVLTGRRGRRTPPRRTAPAVPR